MIPDTINQAAGGTDTGIPPAAGNTDTKKLKIPLVEFRNVCKYYQMGDTTVKASDDITFTIYEGEFVAIVGQSGSGKSTIMNIIGCLDVPTSGEYILQGINVSGMSKDELAEVRNKKMGFIFQQYNLLPKLNLVENVEVPLMYAGMSRRDRRKIALERLAQVGLEEKYKHKPNELSGGQQQRVSIARALAGNPSVILADEPTGALDSRTGREVMEILKGLHREGHSIILITHDNSLAVQAERIIRLEDGHIIYDGPADRPEAVVSASSAQAEPAPADESPETGGQDTVSDQPETGGDDLC